MEYTTLRLRETRMGRDGEYDRIVGAVFGIPAEEAAAEESLLQSALARGYISPEQLDACRKEAAGAGDARPTLGRILVQQGALSLERYLDLLGESDGQDAKGRIGKYRLLREVARGGMGIVYEAYDTELKRSVAIKVIREDRESLEIVRRLHREAGIMAQLRHPNIVAVHDVGVARDGSGRPVHFIAMDFIGGETFASAFPSASREERLRMLEEVARAVAYAHSKGILHRDLKPENVLIDSERKVLLTDFGLARGDSFRSRLTQSCQMMGTPQYMAPEQVEGRTREIDGRTDVYALGVMMYQCLTDRLPFSSETPVGLFEQINRGTPISPSRIRSTVPREFEIVCLKAMERERSRRYPTALAFAQDLERLRTGEPIQARPPSVLFKMSRFVRRRRNLFVAGATTAALAFAGWWGWSLSEQGREVSRLKDEARDALKKRDWTKAIFLCEDGYKRTGDSWFADREQSARREQEEERRLQREVIRPIHLRLEHALDQFDIPEANIAAVRTSVQRDLDELLRNTSGTDNPELWKLIGLARYVLGDNETAIAAFERARGSDPTDGETGEYLGMAYVRHAMLERIDPDEGDNPGRAARSSEWCEKAVRAIPRDGENWRGVTELRRATVRAYHEFAKGSMEELARICREGDVRFSDTVKRAEFSFLLGWCWRISDPLPHLNDAIRLSPHHALAYLCRGEYWKSQGKYEEAIQDLDRCLSIQPNLYCAIVLRGIAWDCKGDRKKAIADYSTALEIRPRSAQVFTNRGAAWAAEGEVEKALEDYRMAIEIRPNHSKAHYNLGNSLLAADDLHGAIASYSKAIRWNPDFFEAYGNRADAFRTLAKIDPARAQDHFRSALDDYGSALELYSKAKNSVASHGVTPMSPESNWLSNERMHQERYLSQYGTRVYLLYARRGIVLFELARLQPARKKELLLEAEADFKQAQTCNPSDRNDRASIEDCLRQIHELLR